MINKNYNNDKIFLSKHLRIVELKSDNKRLLVSPDLQGRVLTSSANGDQGYSFGWLNYDLIESGKFLPHCNNFGGEDRFWLGPEGGQYSIFFKGESGKSFDFKDWQAPSLIDTDYWTLTDSSDSQARFTISTVLENWSGSALACRLDRSVTLLKDADVEQLLGVKLPQNLDYVAFKSENSLMNNGDFEWNEKTGMLSIWILGQFIPSSQNRVIIPYRPSSEAQINDRYFGKIDPDRLQITDTHLLFKGDGAKRGKIGTPPEMTLPLAGAYDAENGTLTIVKFSFDPSNRSYVNSMWEYQNEPFRGDVINSYNDGPLEDGSVMGPFYEIETSSPAANLKPGESLVHEHTTMHFKGEFSQLNELAKQVLGLELQF